MNAIVQIAIVVVVVSLCSLLLARRVFGKLGLGKPEGKPDCGCGTCAEKKKRARQVSSK